MRRLTSPIVNMLLRSYMRQFPRECNICGHQGSFYPFVTRTYIRSDAVCPKCHSLPRHRLLKLVFDKTGTLPPSCVLLHFAPEPAITKVVAEHCQTYLTVDLMREDVDRKLDIENLALEDATFDVILCMHILEHVDDRKALLEMKRVLKPGAVAVLGTPVVEGWATTYENPAARTATERLLHFGQSDHVRYYGRDFRQRIKDAGFELSEYSNSGEEMVRYGLMPGETVFFARKPG